MPSSVREAAVRLGSIIAPAFVLSLIAGAGLAAYSTRNKPPAAAEKKKDDDHSVGENHVTLTAQGQASLGLDRPGVVRAVKPGPYSRKVLVPGVVIDRPGETDRVVAARVAGVVTDIKARPGDTVKAGDPLFVLQPASEYLQTAQVEIARTVRELSIAKTKRDQTANLVKTGSRPAADLVADENQVARLDAQLKAGRRQLELFGLAPADVARAERGESVGELHVSAPATAGGVFEVQELRVHLGEQVQAGQPLGTLASHQKLFVEGHAFKSESAALARAAEHKTPVPVEFADEPPGEWPPLPPLTVSHLANEVDPASRTFGFYLPLENTPRTFERDGKSHLVWRFRPGQRVRLRVPVEQYADVFVLPPAAVVRDGAEAYVFSKAGDAFERNTVRVLHEDPTVAVVANDGGITSRQLLVLDGAAALNRAIKGGGGHTHDHDH